MTMYIDQIDDLIDKIIDDFYNVTIAKSKDIKKYFEDLNFVKNQLEINRLLTQYFSQIDKKSINNILKDDVNTDKMIDFLKRYIAYYIFMMFGFFYTGKIETFINNIIEFSKNQPSFNFKINNFFNSESNSTIIKFYTLLKNVTELVDSDAVKLKQLSKKANYSDAVKFIDELGEDIVNSSFNLKKLNGNKYDQAHNIIKTIIIFNLYIKQDKKTMHEFLDKSEKETGEFIYIDIVVPETDFIDFNTIELSLSSRDVENGLASEIYDLLSQYDQGLTQMKAQTHEEKINELFDRKLLIPIVEDFVLYHKDTEKYEKISATQNPDTKTKKKEETKIKYIINKIDGVTELFSKNTKTNKKLKENIEKLLYRPLLDRRAILINNYEDIKIITKLQNQGRKAIESNEFYNDLLTYTQYPYINFKDFQKYGFPILPTTTIDGIRSTSFEGMDNNKPLQARVGNGGNVLNVTGLIIPSLYTDIKCLKKNELIDVRKVGIKKDKKVITNPNGYTTTLKMITRNIMSNKKYPVTYWLFDINKDKVKMDNYDVTAKLNDTEYFKIIISKLHNDIVVAIGNKIIKYFDNKKEVMINDFYKLIKKINTNIINIPDNSKLYNELERLVYSEKIIKTKDVYDVKEDEFPGLTGDIIKLPLYNGKQQPNIYHIRLDKTRKSDKKAIIETNKIEHGAICQHYITWDNISAQRTKNPNQFSELLFGFFQQYVDKNHEDDYVCKSCGVLINLKNYVLDGTYDDDGRFVSLSMTMQVQVEDIPGYEKYKSAIRNIEKTIDRLASISNIKTLTGASTTIKNRVQKIVKDTVDLVLIHNARLKDIYKERSQKISVYGINKDLSNLFVFELDNSIFIYSSKDKDTYKPIKRNNILTYLLFLMILEISDSQLYFMTGDKICNYYSFSKYGIKWFENMYIRKNNQNTVTKITNYRVLCYIIFYMSHMIIKRNMWKHEAQEEREEKDEPKKKFDINMQKAIIHTLVDFINSVIEIYSDKNKKNYIYDMVANRFFQKLSTTFQNEEILDRIKTMEEKKLVVDGKKIKMSEITVKPILLSNTYEQGDYAGQQILEARCKGPKYFISKRNIKDIKKYLEITNTTNCEEGSFHKWITKNDILVCSICNKTTSEVTSSKKDNIAENYKYIEVEKIVKKYCKAGHELAKKKDCDKLNKKEVNDIYSKMQQIKEEKRAEDLKNVVKHEKVKKDKDVKHKEFINNIKSEYGKTKRHREDYYKFIDSFVIELEKILGRDKNLYNQDIYLRYDTYIIKHDYNGFPIPQPIIITDVNNKILSKKNHPFFNTDVIYYRNSTLQVEVYYDAINKLLLGYKKKNEEIKHSKKTNVYLEVNYSIMSMIKQLCYPSKNIDISEKMENYKSIFNKPEEALAFTISDISRERIQKLKKTITDFQKYVYRVAYNYNAPVISLIDVENKDNFLDKYKEKLSNIILKQEKKYKFLKNWKAIKYELFFEDITTKTINIDPKQRYLSVDEISEYDYSGNVILFYIIQEMTKLIEVNKDKFVKSTLCYLLVDIIMRIYNEYDVEKDMSNGQIKRFLHILQTMDYTKIEDIQGETEGLYEEYKDPDAIPDEAALEKEEDIKEENEAIDMEDELDYEIDYTAGVNIDS